MKNDTKNPCGVFVRGWELRVDSSYVFLDIIPSLFQTKFQVHLSLSSGLS